MKCSRCGEEMKIKKIQTGTDRHGNPIYHKYAVCYHCKIKRNLEKGQNTSSSRNRRKRKKKKPYLLITLLILLILGLSAGFLFYKKQQSEKEKEKENVITNQHTNLIEVKDYNDLKLGMTLDEVIDQIGTDGNSLTKTTLDSAVTERLQWVTKEGDGTVLLTFLDEKLVSISQTGMKDSDSSEIPENLVTKLKPGMALKDVNVTLESTGIRISETILDGVTTSVYAWGQNGNDYFYTAVFIDDKMQTLPKKKIE